MQLNDDLLFAAATFLAGLAIGWFLWDYSKRVPATSYYQQQQQHAYNPPVSYYGQYYQPPPQFYQPPPQHQPQPQPDRVQNDEDIQVFYNRDGSIKNMKVHRDVH